MRKLLWLIALLWCVPSFGALGFVTSSNCASTVSGANCTITSTGAGHLLVIHLFNGSNTVTFSAVGDGASDATAQAVGSQCSAAGVGVGDIWYVKNTSAGVTTITATTSNSANWTGVVQEFSGTNTSAPLDQVGALNTQSGSNPLGPSITETGAEVIASAAMVASSVSAIFGGNAFTNDSLQSGNGWAHLLTGGSGTYQAQWTGASQGYCSTAASFKAAGGGTNPAQYPRILSQFSVGTHSRHFQN